MWRGILVVSIAIWAAGARAEAVTISGADDPQFADARAAWLDGDDLTALEAFRDLARADNIAAQILLARIAEEPHMHRNVTGDMDRSTRIDLLKSPGGLSGTSWLRLAAPSSELASALILRNVAFSSAEVDGLAIAPEAMAAVRVLLDHGETALATEVAFKLIDGVFYRETLNLLDRYQDQLDPIAKSLRAGVTAALAAASDDPDGALSQATELLETLTPEDELALAKFYPWQVQTDQALRDLITRYAELVPAWEPLRDLCESSCAHSYDSCLLAGGTAIGYARRFPFSSPLQTLIPDAEYWSSARIRGDIARKMTEIKPAFEAAAEIDLCFGETVAALAR